MTTLADWTTEVCAALGLDASVVDTELVLNLARDVAHGVARPAAPLTAYLVGVAVGRGAEPAGVLAAVAELARSHTSAATE